MAAALNRLRPPPRRCGPGRLALHTATRALGGAVDKPRLSGAADAVPVDHRPCRSEGVAGRSRRARMADEQGEDHVDDMEAALVYLRDTLAFDTVPLDRLDHWSAWTPHGSGPGARQEVAAARGRSRQAVTTGGVRPGERDDDLSAVPTRPTGARTARIRCRRRWAEPGGSPPTARFSGFTSSFEPVRLRRRRRPEWRSRTAAREGHRRVPCRPVRSCRRVTAR
jgi:hypothetical protein